MMAIRKECIIGDIHIMCVRPRRDDLAQNREPAEAGIENKDDWTRRHKIILADCELRFSCLDALNSNCTGNWGSVGRLLHWILGLRLSECWLFGWWMNHIPQRPDRFSTAARRADRLISMRWPRPGALQALPNTRLKIVSTCLK